MKALSIKQPWAWLICSGYKDVENRSRPTDFRGRIYVHAGAKVDQSAIPIQDYRISIGPQSFIPADVSRRMCIEAIDDWKQGAIIGEVDITDCKFRFGEELDSLYSKWHEPGRYGLVLANPVLYEKPIPCKGKLGFFEPPGVMKRSSGVSILQ